MAWIKMGNGLPRHPKVLSIAAALKLRPMYVVGIMHTLWAMADEHTTTGRLAGMTRASIDALLEHEGAAVAIEAVDWIRFDDKGAIVPRFNTHNGNSAKQRALTAQRVQRFKARKGNAASVTPARPRAEQSRAEKNTENQAGEVSIAPRPACLPGGDVVAGLKRLGIQGLMAVNLANAGADLARARQIHAQALADPKVRDPVKVTIGILAQELGIERPRKSPKAGNVYTLTALDRLTTARSRTETA